MDGYGDAFSVGYNEFNRPSDSRKVKNLLTKDYDISKISKNKKKSRELTKFNPQSLHNNNNCYEFGLSNIEDFSFGSSGSKNSLGGSDLSQVHSNYETWGKTIEKDTRLYNKYNKTNDLKKEMEKKYPKELN